METLKCRSCGNLLTPGLDLTCPRCHFPVERTRARVRRQSDTAMVAPVEQREGASQFDASSPGDEVTTNRACDHAGSPAGSVLCAVCGELLQSTRATSSAPEISSGQTILTFPWGTFQLCPGCEVEIGREVGQFKRALQSYDTVGRRHASIVMSESGKVLVQDHGSTNGTFIDGRRCPPTGLVEVQSGSRLSFSSRLRVDVEIER